MKCLCCFLEMSMTVSKLSWPRTMEWQSGETIWRTRWWRRGWRTSRWYSCSVTRRSRPSPSWRTWITFWTLGMCLIFTRLMTWRIYTLRWSPRVRIWEYSLRKQICSLCTQRMSAVTFTQSSRWGQLNIKYCKALINIDPLICYLPECNVILVPWVRFSEPAWDSSRPWLTAVPLTGSQSGRPMPSDLWLYDSWWTFQN